MDPKSWKHCSRKAPISNLLPSIFNLLPSLSRKRCPERTVCLSVCLSVCLCRVCLSLSGLSVSLSGLSVCRVCLSVGSVGSVCLSVCRVCLSVGSVCLSVGSVCRVCRVCLSGLSGLSVCSVFQSCILLLALTFVSSSESYVPNMFALKFAGQEESESYSSPSSSSEKKEEDPAVQKEGGPAEKKEAPLEKKDENLWVQVAKKAWHQRPRPGPQQKMPHPEVAGQRRPSRSLRQAEQ